MTSTGGFSYDFYDVPLLLVAHVLPVVCRYSS